MVTLLGEVVGPRELAGLPLAARVLFQHISRVDRAGTGELVRRSAFSRPVVLRGLRLLESRGLVRWVGNTPTDPRAYWTTGPLG